MAAFAAGYCRVIAFDSLSPLQQVSKVRCSLPGSEGSIIIKPWRPASPLSVLTSIHPPFTFLSFFFLSFSTHRVKRRHQELLRNPVMAPLLQTPVQALIRILISSAPHCFSAPRRSRWALRLELRVYYTTRGGHNWLFFNRITVSGEYCQRAVLGAWGRRQLQQWSEVLNPLPWWSFLFKKRSNCLALAALPAVQTSREKSSLYCVLPSL